MGTSVFAPAPIELLTMTEVARALRISKTHAYRLAQIGELPAVRFGSLVRVRPVDLEQFISAHMPAQCTKQTVHSWGEERHNDGP